MGVLALLLLEDLLVQQSQLAIPSMLSSFNQLVFINIIVLRLINIFIAET